MREPWPEPFRDEGPYYLVEEDFAARRQRIVRTQAESPLEPEHERQRRGDEQAVGKMPAHERPHGKVRLQQPAIQRVRSAGHYAHRIPPVTEWRDFQSSAKITAPDATARMSLRSMIMRAGYAGRIERQENKGPSGETHAASFTGRAKFDFGAMDPLR